MDPDPFKVLGLTANFRISREEVETAYLARSTQIHPDLATGNEDAARQMAGLNLARRILVNPESRAEAVLNSFGGPTAAQERSLPEGFLAEMMDVRERIEAAMAESPDQARSTWDQWSRQQRDRAIESVAALFDEASTSDCSRTELLRAVRIRLNAWRYIERLFEQLDPGTGSTP